MCMICRLQERMLRLAVRVSNAPGKFEDIPESMQRRLQASALLLTAASNVIDGEQNEQADMAATLMVNRANIILQHVHGCHISTQKPIPEGSPN